MEKQSNCSRSSVSESFFDKFTEYKWNKCIPSGSFSNPQKTQYKKKYKIPPPLFIGSSENTQVERQESTSELGSSSKVCADSDVIQHLKMETIQPFHSLREKTTNLKPSEYTSTYQREIEKFTKNVFRRNAETIDSGRLRKSISESEGTDISNALSELKLLDQWSHSSPVKKLFNNCTGYLPGTSLTDTSQDEFDSDMSTLLSNCNSSNLTAFETVMLKKMKKDKTKHILKGEDIYAHNSAIKNNTCTKKRSKSQPASHINCRNGGNLSPGLNTTLSSPAIRNDNTSGRKRRKSKTGDKFEGLIELEEALRGVQEKILIQGELRINPKNYVEAYITHPLDSQDVLIRGVADRNRALEGDLVVVQIKENDKWKKQQNGTIQKTGKVVYIFELVHTRSLIGLVQKYNDNFAMLRPRDCRLPRLLVSIPTLPDQLRHNLDKYADVYFKAQIVCWNSPQFALGLIDCMIGKKGEVSGETEAILRELDLDSAPVPESLNKYLPPIPYTISQEEINNRLDLRKETVFSIDPETARDLDDALSIKKISSNTYEIGVHISDVSYFLTEGTPLDNKISDRATTIYMVDRVNHMLPVQLCMLCSLLPGEDKLAFSVIWEMDEQGTISSTKFSRTVIHSCAQLCYGHAQDIIDGKETVDFPQLYNGKTEKEIRESILALSTISKNITAKRFAGGALRIDRPKVAFKLDDDSLPCDAYLYVLKDSNRLIEEFMLLANQSVAEFIHKQYPNVALLRRHPPPKEEMIAKLEASLNKLGIFIETASSGTLHNSLQKYIQGDPARATVLNFLCSKAMNRAVYYCDEQDTHHYALNIEMYTHFTSPIRRYVDIVVHRVLAAALGYTVLPPWNNITVRQFAKNSNQKKNAAKRAGEASSELFTSLYIRKLGTLETEAIVFNINSNSLDTVVTSVALKIRVYIEDLDNVEIVHKENDIASSLHIKWKQLHYTQVVQIFSEVRLLLKTQESSLQIEAQLLPPTLPTYTSDSSTSYHNTITDNDLPFG